MAINDTLLEQDEDERDSEEEEDTEGGKHNFERNIDVSEQYLARNVDQEGDADQSNNPDEHLYQNYEISKQTMVCDEKLNLLRNLLASERRNNSQRRRNNQALQQYVRQVQADYLRSQRDVLEALQLGRNIKLQKEAQLAALSNTVEEKDRLIEQLRLTLDNLDERKLRDEFKELLDKQKQLADMEKEQLHKQVDTIQQQLVGERVNNSQILQQFRAKLDDQLSSHDKETQAFHEQVSKLENQLKQMLEEPREIIIRDLKEENSKLSCQLEETNLRSDESLKRFEFLKKRLESLMADQEQMEQSHNEELERFHLELNEQRAQLTKLKLELDDKEDLLQVLQFNLNRSEKRAKSFLLALKGKESAHKELIGLMEVKHEDDVERSTIQIRTLETKLVELEGELDKKRNEMINMELIQENQLESIRNDRDQRIQKMVLENQKANRELQAAEIKLAHETEERESRCRQVEQLQREVNQFREESKRLSIELTKSEAKLFSKQKELNETIKTSKQCLLIPARPLSAKTNRTVRYNHSNHHHKRNKITSIYADSNCEAII